MHYKEWLNHGLLRVKLRFFAPLTIGLFSIFCVFVMYTIFGFLKWGNLRMLSVTSCILYLTTQFSSYYLLYAPCMMILLSGLNELGAFELLLYARCTSRKDYDWGCIFAIFLFVLLCVVGSVGAAGVVYRFAANPEAGWYPYCEYLRNRGIYVVSEGMAQSSAVFVVFAQLTMSALSFYAIGLFLLLLRHLFQKAFLVLLTGLGTNLMLLLMLKSDLPGWLFSILPYSRLFLPYLNSLSDFFSAVIYWLCVIVGLHFAVRLFAGFCDRGLTDYET